ncbi:tRNA (adenosine(37)-N6)-threonylcarbamoyltransferase complex ATPase subunit type 1 TsaE [Actinomyces culturomici]|uniref:tRNA (adenosine(37)-N6)-threonylcarbamoyltransferase complex ATPase subunit type 1 TsaE n=1 Tax=Actinomyces culturomici TaxID=1926276 RepID=UPI000E203843|nr:tRNA (adenosine(37)-N6)-threonylcarbamoyltransferase complex ATPase subunit type 1 TsaE [Actinomyces culturomici]
MTALSMPTSSADETRALGRALGEVLKAGDLVMLRGGLGAGKTTLTQGIGEGMGVRGRVASPTFIVARVHPSTHGGPDLIHADAYRIRDLEDLETLDLDSSLAGSVTVVEWGEGKTEAMSDERLEIDVVRATGGDIAHEDGAVDLETMDDGARVLELHPHGSRWDGVLEPVLARAAELARQYDSAAQGADADPE